jgi:hypothetical protein
MYQLIEGGIVDDMIVAMFVSITRYIFFQNKGLWECNFSAYDLV